MSLQLITCRCGVSHGARLRSTMNSESWREAPSIPLWSDRLLAGSIPPRAMLYQLSAAVVLVLQRVLAPPAFTGLEDIRAGGPQYHHCIPATLRWAVSSSLPISSPRKQYEGEGNPTSCLWDPGVPSTTIASLRPTSSFPQVGHHQVPTNPFPKEHS